MNIKIKTFLLSGILFWSCTNTESPEKQNKKTDLQLLALKAQVKTITSFTIQPANPEATQMLKPVKTRHMEFNEAGYLTLSHEFRGNPTPFATNDYTYNAKGLVAARKETRHYNEPIITNYAYAYNEVDSLTQMEVDNGFNQWTYYTQRDAKNRPILKQVIQADTVASLHKMTYDTQGNLTREESYYTETHPDKFISRTFNENGQKVKEVITDFKDTGDTLHYTNHFFYKDDQLSREERNKTSDSVFTEITYTYHPNGKLQQEIIMPKGAENYAIIIQKYNTHGDITYHASNFNSDPKKDIFTTQYTYDTHENWTEKTNYKNDTIVSKTTRDITYYE